MIVAAPSLSPREREILRLLRTGETRRDVARALQLSPYTVDTHMRSALQKLHVHSLVAALAVLEGPTGLTDFSE